MNACDEFSFKWNARMVPIKMVNALVIWGGDAGQERRMESESWAFGGGKEVERYETESRLGTLLIITINIHRQHWQSNTLGRSRELKERYLAIRKAIWNVIWNAAVWQTHWQTHSIQFGWTVSVCGLANCHQLIDTHTHHRLHTKPSQRLRCHSGNGKCWQWLGQSKFRLTDLDSDSNPALRQCVCLPAYLSSAALKRRYEILNGDECKSNTQTALE